MRGWKRSAPVATGSSLPLVVAGLSVDYGLGSVLKSINMTVEPGESVAIVGPSGAGKTTLLNCIAGIVKPTEGTIAIHGIRVDSANASKLNFIRSNLLGIVFQSGELISELSPVENVALPALIGGGAAGLSTSKALALLEMVGVPPSRNSVNQLSGGERQRTAFARAIINDPALILADEPTGSLDPATRDHVADIFFALPQQQNCGALIVTHDLEVAARANRTINLGEFAS